MFRTPGLLTNHDCTHLVNEEPWYCLVTCWYCLVTCWYCLVTCNLLVLPCNLFCVIRSIVVMLKPGLIEFSERAVLSDITAGTAHSTSIDPQSCLILDQLLALPQSLHCVVLRHLLFAGHSFRLANFSFHTQRFTTFTLPYIIR